MEDKAILALNIWTALMLTITICCLGYAEYRRYHRRQ